jgi:putative ABC transport system permease protein
MSFGRVFRRLLQLPASSPRTVGRDVDDEVGFHLEMRARELAAAGVPPDEARRRARAEFGDVDAARSALRREAGALGRARRRATIVDELGQDVRYAFRQLRRNPTFTAVSVLTLALAVGANAAIFSTVHGVLLSQLPFTTPDRLVRVYSDFRGRRASMSAPDYQDFQRTARSFSALAAPPTSRAAANRSG